MAVALLDSNLLIAFTSRRDEHHDAAMAILSAIDQGELPTGRVTNYVVAEALGYITERHRHETATDLYERLKAGAGFEIVHCTKSDFSTAESIFDGSPQLSFVDATLVAYARQNDLDYLYSFDDDFDGIDRISRLDTAENSFS